MSTFNYKPTMIPPDILTSARAYRGAWWDLQWIKREAEPLWLHRQPPKGDTAARVVHLFVRDHVVSDMDTLRERAAHLEGLVGRAGRILETSIRIADWGPACGDTPRRANALLGEILRYDHERMKATGEPSLLDQP